MDNRDFVENVLNNIKEENIDNLIEKANNGDMLASAEVRGMVEGRYYNSLLSEGVPDYMAEELLYEFSINNNK